MTLTKQQNNSSLAPDEYRDEYHGSSQDFIRQAMGSWDGLSDPDHYALTILRAWTPAEAAQWAIASAAGPACYTSDISTGDQRYIVVHEPTSKAAPRLKLRDQISS